MAIIDRVKKALGILEPLPRGETILPPPSGPFQLRQALGWKQSPFNSVAWSPNGKYVAAASDDTCIYIWNTTTFELEHLLEGHQNWVWSVAWSPDGRLLASGSDDNTLRVWDCNTWQEVQRYNSPSAKYFLLAVDFRALSTVAATFGDEDVVVRAWDLEAGTISTEQIAVTSLHSISAKIVFVGESNVGKSCLALRLAEDRYEEQGSTLGMKLWTLQPEQLDPSAATPPSEKRDIILWDLGGQDEYRLVHQLFLHDTTLALVLLDPTRGRTAFEEVEGWNLRLEKQARGREMIKLLVGTKLDEEWTTIDQADLQQLIKNCGFAGYFPTSAKKPRGMDELRAAIAQALDWDNLTKITRPVVFQQVRDAITTRREGGEIVLPYRDLEEQIHQDNPENFDPADVNTVVQQLAVQGVVVDTRESSGQRVLVLRLEEIERYAGSLILAARGNPRGVPALEEREITAGRLAFPGIAREERLHPFQERIVLESLIQLLLEHGICFKHEGLLIFPALFPAALTREAAKTGESVSLYYDFSGPIDNIYSTLAVTLALSERFGRVRLWADGAEYEKPGQGVCGIRKVANKQGVAHVDLYFSAETPRDTRNLFIVFIEDHLRKEGVTITEGLQLSCIACGYRFEQTLLGEHLAAGLREIPCPRPTCKTANIITPKAADVRASTPEVEQEFFALKRIVEQRSTQEVVEIKREFARADRTLTGSEPLRILHLSDLHITGHENPMTRLQPLLADLRDKDGGFGFERLDYLVLSGDLTNRATPEEFDKVYQLISELINKFELSAERCIIVPGNHDLSWDEQVYDWRQQRLVDEAKQPAGSFVPQGNGYLVRNEAQYPQRFLNFGKFYHSLVQQPYPLQADEQGWSFLFPDVRLQFLALNSAWEIDEFFKERSSINDGALASVLLKADEQIKAAQNGGALAKDAMILRLAVWHHPVTGNEKIVHDTFLERLRKADFRLCLHGHVHEERADLVGYGSQPDSCMSLEPVRLARWRKTVPNRRLGCTI